MGRVLGYMPYANADSSQAQNDLIEDCACPWIPALAGMTDLGVLLEAYTVFDMQIVGSEAPTYADGWLALGIKSSVPQSSQSL